MFKSDKIWCAYLVVNRVGLRTFWTPLVEDKCGCDLSTVAIEQLSSSASDAARATFSNDRKNADPGRRWHVHAAEQNGV